MKEKLPALSPRQHNCFDAIRSNIGDYKIFCLWVSSGLGRTTILNHLKKTLAANMIGMSDFAAIRRDKHPDSIQDDLYALLEANLEPGKPLILDDYHLILKVGGNSYSNPRAGYENVIARAIVEFCHEKK